MTWTLIWLISLGSLATGSAHGFATRTACEGASLQVEHSFKNQYPGLLYSWTCVRAN